jgi:hypothetical protein
VFYWFFLLLIQACHGVKCFVDCFFYSDLLHEHIFFILLDLCSLFFELCLKSVLLMLHNLVFLYNFLLCLFQVRCGLVVSQLVLNEGKLQSHQPIWRVDQAHLPTMVLLRVGVQWTLRGLNKGIFVHLLVMLQFYHTWLLIFLCFFAKYLLRHLL